MNHYGLKSAYEKGNTIEILFENKNTGEIITVAGPKRVFGVIDIERDKDQALKKLAHDIANALCKVLP